MPTLHRSALRHPTLYLAATLLLAGCAPPTGDTAGGLPEDTAAPFDGPAISDGVEHPREGELGEIRYSGPAGNFWAPYRVINGMMVSGGHIILGPAEESVAGEIEPYSTGMAVVNDRWPGCRIAYEIDGLDSDDEDNFRDAIAHWEENTDFTFVEDPDAVDRIVAAVDPDISGYCYSRLGRSGGAQDIGFDPDGCSTSTLIHELGHAVGLLHEHTRSDREDYINVHEDNILEGHEDQFPTWVEDGDDAADYGDYDFHSVMHYSSNTFVDNPDACYIYEECLDDGLCVDEITYDIDQCTILKQSGSGANKFIWSDDDLSSGDIAGAHEMYYDCALRPDIELSELSVSNYDIESGTFDVEIAAENTGDEHSGRFHWAVYFSTDSTIGTRDSLACTSEDYVRTYAVG